MDERVFDSLVRRAAGTVCRRGLIGLFSGAVLSLKRPLAVDAGGGGKGHKKKNKKKGCKHKADRDRCSGNFSNYCSIAYDGEQFNACFAEYHHCCGFWCSDLDSVEPCLNSVLW